ncbi:MAG: DUF721 domain-containing protein [Armatimonadetes bacterium]|nr:DUF721 domain-containing protein [Armatimonadota bacterium]
MNRMSDGVASPLKDAVESLLRQRGLLKVSREALVPVLWPQVVGPWYARHIRVVRVDDGVVTVKCDSASRAQQLQLDANRIIEALNERLESRTVREIRASTGAVSWREPGVQAGQTQAPQGPSQWELDAMALTSNEARWVESVAARIEEGPLRDQARRVLANQCKIDRWKVERGYRPCELCGVLVRPGVKRCRSCDPGRIPAQGTHEVPDTEYADRTSSRRGRPRGNRRL